MQGQQHPLKPDSRSVSKCVHFEKVPCEQARWKGSYKFGKVKGRKRSQQSSRARLVPLP